MHRLDRRLPRAILLVLLAVSPLPTFAESTPASAPASAPAWVATFDTADEPQRRDILEQLWRDLRFATCTEDHVEPLLRASRDVSYRVRHGAIRVLQGCGETESAGEIASRLRQIFDDPSEERQVRRAVIPALGSLGVADAATLDLLVTVAADPDERIFSQSAVAALGVLGVATDETLDVVVAALDAGTRSPRVSALVALNAMADSLLTLGDPAIERVVAAVCRQLPAPDIDVNQQAALLLARFGPKAASAVPTLISTFEQRQFSRSQVAHALGEIGPAAAVAIPMLRAEAERATGPEKTTFDNVLGRLLAARAEGDRSIDTSDDPMEKQP